MKGLEEIVSCQIDSTTDSITSGYGQMTLNTFEQKYSLPSSLTSSGKTERGPKRAVQILILSLLLEKIVLLVSRVACYSPQKRLYFCYRMHATRSRTKR